MSGLKSTFVDHNNFSGPLCLAFLFFKSGTEIYAGSFESIQAKARKIQLCHGIVHVYSNKKVESKIWRLFGSSQSTAPKPGSYDLIKVSRKRVLIPTFLGSVHPFSVHAKPNLKKHTRYALINWYGTEHTEYTVIKEYRRLPSEFLKDLIPLTSYSSSVKTRNRYSLIRGKV